MKDGFNKPSIVIAYVVKKGDWIVEIYDGILDRCGRPIKEAWLHHVDYGIKTHILGVPGDSCDLQTFLDIVEFNLKDEIRLYVNTYFDEEDEE